MQYFLPTLERWAKGQEGEIEETCHSGFSRKVSPASRCTLSLSNSPQPSFCFYSLQGLRSFFHLHVTSVWWAHDVEPKHSTCLQKNKSFTKQDKLPRSAFYENKLSGYNHKCCFPQKYYTAHGSSHTAIQLCSLAESFVPIQDHSSSRTVGSLTHLE